MTLPPVPRTGQVLEQIREKIHYHWDNWFQAVLNALTLTSREVASVALTTQAATVNATAFTTSTLSAGLYRLTYYARISRAATVSSSLTVRVDWTDGGHACSVTEAAITGNTVTTTQAGIVPFQIDAGTSPTYTLTYATSGMTTMQFAFTAGLEALP